MNEITRLQRTHELTPEPGEDVLVRARARLDAAIADQSTVLAPAAPTTNLRHLRARTILIASIAAAAAAVIVASSAGLVTSESATASDLLHIAAGRTADTADPTAGPGQYLRVETRAAYLAWDIDAVGTTAYVAPEVDDLYIPADRSHTWVRTVTNLKPTEFFGPGGKQSAERDWAQQLKDGVTRTTTRAPGGRFPLVNELGGGTGAVDDLATMPRDPKALLGYLRHSLTKGERHTDPSEREQFEFDHVASLLESGAVPADLRAGLYGALALMPGVTIVANATVLDGRTGTAFGLGDYKGTSREELVIDPESGVFIGARSVLVDDYGTVPAGTTMEYTAVRTTIVNGLP